jgi:outer membrane immunogenic protein
MKKLVLGLLATTAVTLSLSATNAADLPRRTMAPAPYVAAPVFTWSGFYFGVNAGYGWSENGDDDRFDLGAGVIGGNTAGRIVFTHNEDADGFLGGAQIGWNYQFTPGTGFVVGIEADIQGISLDHDRTNNVFTFSGAGITGANFVPVRTGASSLDWFGTVRGRIGYAFDRVLVYGTGGFAYGGGDHNNGCPTFVAGVSTATFCNNGDDTRWGYAVGGGVEWALPVTASLFGSSAVTFGIEGLYVNLDDDNDHFRDGRGSLAGFNAATGAPVFTATGRSNDETEFGLVRAKVNFKF